MEHAELEANIRQVSALKHDLGKYIAWRSINFSDAAWQQEPFAEELMNALIQDILCTRTNSCGTFEPAWVIWERLANQFQRPFLFAELTEVETAVHTLRVFAPLLMAKKVAEIFHVRFEIRNAQQLIRSRLQHLHKMLLEKLRELNVVNSHH